MTADEPEPVCECGHVKSVHRWNRGPGCLYCDCELFRREGGYWPGCQCCVLRCEELGVFYAHSRERAHEQVRQDRSQAPEPVPVTGRGLLWAAAILA